MTPWKYHLGYRAWKQGIYFGARRVRGKRGRGAGGKPPVFGLLKRNGKVYTEIVSDCSKNTLQGIIRGRVGIDSVIHSDGWRGYDGLVDLGYKKHYRVNHSQDEFVRGKSHINGIESFCGYSTSITIPSLVHDTVLSWFEF